MAEKYSQEINKENVIESKINFIFRLDNILVYILIAIDKIFVLFKYIISTKLELFSSQEIIHPKDISYSKCCLFEVKIILYLIQFIIISILYQIKSNVNFDLFHYQVSKITLKIKGIGDSYILGNETDYNFTGFKNLKEVYINGLKQNTIDYLYYFNQSDNLVELIWDDDINSCVFMFRKCSNITEIDLSNFNTSHVTSMNNMFAFCSSLISLDLSNIDTNHVTRIFAMFYGCISLTSLNLSNFDTSQVNNMQNLFYNCSSLTSLDLSNFKTTTVKNMQYMFYDCVNLEYINLNNFEENKLVFANNMFDFVPGNVVYCINSRIIDGKMENEIKYKKCPVFDCSNEWKSKQNKIINNNNECIESCDNSSEYPYEYNGKCYENCTKGYLLDESGNITNKCKCELDQCLLCPNVASNKNLCTKCNINYYQKENDPSNLGEYINCYNQTPEGYYLENNFYKQCYHTCKTCNISGNNRNHNCIECNDNYPIGIKNENYLNCYENCSYYYYFDNEFNYYCTEDSSCPNEYYKLKVDTRECIKNDINTIIADLIINKTEKMPREEEIEYYDNLIKAIEQTFTSENFDTSKIDNGQDEYIETGKIIVTLTTLENQRKHLNKNMSVIDLGYCESLLKNGYNISDNETIYMKKIDIAQNGMKITKIKFDVYCKLNGTNLIKLNLQ